LASVSPSQHKALNAFHAPRNLITAWLLQLLQRLIDRETCCLLPWWKVLEGRQELADIGLLA